MKTLIPSTTKFKGKIIKDLRTIRGLSMAELGVMVGCDASSISLWERNEQRPSVKSLRKIAEYFKVPISAFFVLIFCLIATPAHADVNRDDAIRTIVGEAANQGLDGMTAVGEVIRNGGHTFYGRDRKIDEPAWVWKQAANAWDRSEHTNLAQGATKFENIAAFGFPKSWDREKVICVSQIKDHWFFVEG